MPFIHVRVAAPSFTLPQIERIQKGVTRLMADCLHKKAELTAVLVEQAPSGGWAIGAAPASIAAHVDATITQGTNTREEKARFIEQAHALLGEVLGEMLPLATYVVITEVDGENWGYAGQTQAHRAAMRGA